MRTGTEPGGRIPALNGLRAFAISGVVLIHLFGISGVLVFDGTHFAQWLEGPLNRLELLLARLRLDTRHSDLRVHARSRLPSVRRFAGWQLGA